MALFQMKLGILILGVILPTFAIAQGDFSLKSNYRMSSSNICDGFPKIAVKTPENMCVGIVAGKDNGLRMPRYAAQSLDGTLYVTDMAGWSFARGTVYALNFESINNQNIPILKNLFPKSKLTMPNGIAVDPEGRVYVGTPTGIFRFSPKDERGNLIENPELEPIFTDFAESIFRKAEYKNAEDFDKMSKSLKNKHPLVQITANANFTEMYVNLGAPSDDCGSGLKKLDQNDKCIQSESPLASAAVWKLKFENTKERKLIEKKVFSRGLRNSMALAIHPASGFVFQGENSFDLPDENLPYEEINFLQEGKHYGWPYCHSDAKVSPLFERKVSIQDCKQKYQLPLVFMPAHAAPLGMIFPKGFGKLSELKDKMLISWHGYRNSGHRIVAYNVDESGKPMNNQFEELVTDWDAQEDVRPRGAPTGLTELRDGSILILDDKNSAILRLSSGRSESVVVPESEKYQFREESLQKFAELLPLLKTNCALCHTQFQKNTNQEVLDEMTKTMLSVKNPMESLILGKIQRQEMPPESYRPAINFNGETQEQIEIRLLDFLRSL